MCQPRHTHPRPLAASFPQSRGKLSTIPSSFSRLATLSRKFPFAWNTLLSAPRPATMAIPIVPPFLLTLMDCVEWKMVYKNWSCLLHSFFYLFFAFVLDWIVPGRACRGVCVCMCMCVFVYEYQLTRSLRTSSSTVARESILTLIIGNLCVYCVRYVKHAEISLSLLRLRNIVENVCMKLCLQSRFRLI